MKPFKLAVYLPIILTYLAVGFISAVFLGFVFEVAAAVRSTGLPPFTSVVVALVMIGLFLFLSPYLFRGLYGWVVVIGRKVGGLFNLVD